MSPPAHCRSSGRGFRRYLASDICQQSARLFVGIPPRIFAIVRLQIFTIIQLRIFAIIPPRANIFNLLHTLMNILLTSWRISPAKPAQKRQNILTAHGIHDNNISVTKCSLTNYSFAKDLTQMFFAKDLTQIFLTQILFNECY